MPKGATEAVNYDEPAHKAEAAKCLGPQCVNLAKHLPPASERLPIHRYRHPEQLAAFTKTAERMTSSHGEGRRRWELAAC